MPRSGKSVQLTISNPILELSESKMSNIAEYKIVHDNNKAAAERYYFRILSYFGFQSISILLSIYRRAKAKLLLTISIEINSKMVYFSLINLEDSIGTTKFRILDIDPRYFN